ncbi:hypothetical protein V8E53_007962 [Lactarius tabidus]
MSTPNNGKTLSPKLRLSTMGSNANTNGDLSPPVKNKNTTRCRGKLATVTADAHSSGARAEEDLVPVVKVKKCAGHSGKTGQGPSAPVKPTCALPNRSGPNIHPAGLPKSQHSKEQVEADRKAALKASEEQAHKSQMAQDLLVQMDILEEHEEEDLPTRYPQCLSARIDKRHFADIETESDECFDIRVDEDSNLDSPSKPDKATEAKLKITSQRTKHIKGAARQELQSRTTALHLAKRDEKSQAGTSKHGVKRLTPQTFVSKKYTHAGLRQQHPTPTNAAHDEQEETADPFKLGGLGDDNIEETRPTIFKGSHAPATVNQSDLKKNTSCCNEVLPHLVTARVKGQDVHQRKPQTVPKPSKSKATKVTVKQSLHNGQVQQEYVGLNPLVGAHPDISQQCLNDARWTQVFLPTLTHALYISDHPFTDWMWSSSKLVETIQMVFDLSFTNISYALSPEDCVIKATRRLKLANEILILVKMFFDGTEFRNQPERVREYVRWALRSGGPAYYETPVPFSCKLQKDDPNYLKPDGFLHSPFILPIAKSYISFTVKSVLHPSLGPRNPPTGLYALLLTAVERTLRAHMTGVFNAPSDCNQRTTWNSMKDFYKTLNQVFHNQTIQFLILMDSDPEISITDIDDQIATAQESLSLLRRSHPKYSAHVQILAMTRFVRYIRSHQKEDLDKAILHSTEAIILLPIQAKPFFNVVQTFYHLAFALLKRCEEFEQPEGIKYSVEYLQYIRRFPLDSFDFPRTVVTTLLIRALRTQVELGAGNGTQDVKKMVDLCNELLSSTKSELVPTTAFVDLRGAAWALYDRGHPTEMLDEVIECLRDVVKMCPPDSHKVIL